MRVMVGTACADYPSRNNTFFDCFYNLVLPEGSERHRATSNDASANVNLLVDIAQRGNFTHIFIVDDDQMFNPMIVMNLLKHDLDVVCGLYLMRNHPFKPLIFDGVLEDDKQVHWVSLKTNGLTEIIAMGMGCVLIKMEVFNKLEKPYFGIRDGIGDDIQFSRALRRAGIKMFCDTTQTLWHTIKASVAPLWKDNHWVTCIRIGDFNIEIPAWSEEDET